ncbi:hypothetical protein FB451DRAFT_1366594 [Mycena latifolia]|nr:hypothetical protein FB451DRAFT_1366594 [Mycena latifolia]
MIEEKDIDVEALRKTLSQINAQFATVGLKFYFVQDISSNLSGAELVLASKDNVLIETLPAGKLGLPSEARPVYNYSDESGIALKLLHPTVLILTKMKRWAVNYNSTRPKTVLKTESDESDLHWLVHWLAANGLTIDFDNYAGKTKEELLRIVRLYKSESAHKYGVNFQDTLRMAIKPNDWVLL